MMTHDISDELLNAYVDNELDPAERTAVLGRIGADTALRARACGLWQMKQMVRGAYPLPPQKSALAGRRDRSFASPTWPHALAASLLLAVGSLSGWFMHDKVDAEGIPARQIEAIRAESGRVVLHLFSDEPARMEAALHMAEQLAGTRDKAGQPLRVEFLANGPGLHLLRVGGSPYAARIAALQHKHGNLRLLACHEAMERMHERGLNVVLLPNVEVAPSAEGQLAQRLTQGWRYVQV
jgi:intracellular sulfur oxidation DsrE/DsrF family protein